MVFAFGKPDLLVSVCKIFFRENRVSTCEIIYLLRIAGCRPLSVTVYFKRICGNRLQSYCVNCALRMAGCRPLSVTVHFFVLSYCGNCSLRIAGCRPLSVTVYFSF